MRPLHIGQLTLAVMTAAAVNTPAQAGETFSSFRSALQSYDKELTQAALPTDNDSVLVVNGKKYDGGKLAGYPDAAKSLESACANEHKGLCNEQAKAAKIYDAAAKAMGVPALALVCLTKQESAFIPGRTSSAKASGLTQFIPESAKTMQQAMNAPATGSYKKDWEEFKKLGGTERGPASFTAAAMRSGSLSDADVQIFAAAMHFRYFAKPMEPELGEKYKSDSKTSLKDVLHFFLASYNAGGERAKKCFEVHNMDEKHLPQETRGYLKSIDQCIEKATTGRSR